MEINITELKDYEGKVLPVSEFRHKHADGVSAQAINYAMRKGLIDYVKVGEKGHTTFLIVLTERTLQYKPKNFVRKGRVEA